MPSIIEDIEEYTGIPYERIDKESLNPPVAHPTKDDYWKYYLSDEYACMKFRSIVRGDSTPAMQQDLADILDVNLTQPKTLVYGCGEGLIPLALKGMGFEDITIADVPHRYLGYLKFISDKYGLGWEFIAIEPQNEFPLEKEYDYIICNNTHQMEYDTESTLRYLSKHLANFGCIYICDGNPFKDDPSRIAENIGLKRKYPDRPYKLFHRTADKFTGVLKMLNFYPAPLKNTYGFLGTTISDALGKHGYIVNNRNAYPSMECMPYSKTSLILSTPYSFLKASSERTIGFTWYDATRVPDSWVDKCNLMDGLLIPCSSNVDAFRLSGVKAPIELVHPGVDTDIFNPAIFYLGMKDKFYFGHNNLYPNIDKAFKFLVINSGNPKNNNQMIIDAFVEEFQTEIRRRQVYLVLRFCKPWMDARNIVNIRRFLDNREMSLLIHSCDCLISAGSFAVDLPILQGMAHEKPVIVSEGFAHSDDVGIDRGFFIKTKELVQIKSKQELFKDAPEVVLPDIDSLKEKMRLVFDDRDPGGIEGENARKFVMKNRTQDIMANKIMEILER